MINHKAIYYDLSGVIADIDAGYQVSALNADILRRVRDEIGKHVVEAEIDPVQELREEGRL